MTKAEYYALYKKSRDMFPRLTVTAMRELRKSYIVAARDLSKKIIAAEKKGLSELTTQSWRSIEMQLNESAEILQVAIDKNINNIVTIGASRLSRIDEKYMLDVISVTDGRLTSIGIKNMFISMNQRVVASVANRIFQDGYTYSDRIWRAAAAYGDSMKRVITAGLSQGRDLIDIAKDIEVYVRKGKRTLITRYGDLRRGTADFVRRIRGRVDYSALRLVRSELYASMQEEGRLAGQYNPASNGLYDWFRGGTQDWGCECPDYAAGGPYTIETLPSFPHPNCLCRVQPRLRDRVEFVGDLVSWTRGARIEYLDTWYRDRYLPTINL